MYTSTLCFTCFLVIHKGGLPSSSEDIDSLSSSIVSGRFAETEKAAVSSVMPVKMYRGYQGASSRASKRASALDLGRNCREDRDLLLRARRKLFGSRRFLFSVKGDKVARTPGQGREEERGKTLKNNANGAGAGDGVNFKKSAPLLQCSSLYYPVTERERNPELSLPSYILLRGKRGEIRRVFFSYLISRARVVHEYIRAFANV